MVGQVYYSNVNFLIPQSPPSDLSPEIQSALQQVYLSMQQMIRTFIDNCGISSQPPQQWSSFAGNPSTVLRQNLGRFYVTASEAISYGAMVNLYNNGGTINARNANATDNTKPAHGFCNVSGGISAGSTGEVILGSGVNQINGLTPGQMYWLATSNGQLVASRPSAAGNIEQFCGFALSTTQLYINVGGYIQH